jgi:hypothetical protein
MPRYAAMHFSHATLVGRVRRNDSVATADFESIHRSHVVKDEPAQRFRRQPTSVAVLADWSAWPAGSLPVPISNAKASDRR